MSVVNRIPELECKHGVRPLRPELGPQLPGREPVLVQAVVPTDPLQNLQISAHKPIPRLIDDLKKRKKFSVDQYFRQKILWALFNVFLANLVTPKLSPEIRKPLRLKKFFRQIQPRQKKDVKYVQK